MAFGKFGKKKGGSNDAAQDEVRGKLQEDTDQGPDPAAEKQRLKKIKSMKKKFDETVWNSVLDVMKTDMPDFLYTEKDPENPVSEMVYVVLGFDTKIVDDFMNKADDDVGSIMTAIKSSMDVIVENGLFDNELILMIPTSKTIRALDEFRETFDLRFSIVYVKEDHSISIETYPNTENPVIVTLDDVHQKINGEIYIEDWIKAQIKKGGIDEDEGLGPKLEEEWDEPAKDEDDDSVYKSRPDTGDIDGDEAIDDDGEYDDDYEEESLRDEDGPPDDDISDDIPDELPDDVDDKKSRLAGITKDAVASASNVSENISEKREEIEESSSSSGEDVSNSEEEGSTKDAEDTKEEPKTPTSVQDRINKLKGAVKEASDEASKDSEIAGSNIITPTVQVFGVQEMDAYITRKYYSDELDLEVSSEPFDAMFLQNNPYVPFAEDTSGTWLAEQVNNIRRDANARLEKLHQENLTIMRERFMLIINRHCEAVVKAVSTDDPSSRFGHALKAINEIKAGQLANVAQTAETYKREKEDNYQARLKQEMENAANVAKTNFINRYGKEHEREMKDIEQDLRNNIESEYVATYENLQKERKNEAKRQLDVGITEALELCADEYTKMLAMERKEYIRLQEVITKFQNDNMMAEHTRIMTLNEEQRRSNIAVEAQNEYKAKLEAAQADFEVRLAAVRSEIDQNNTEHENLVQNMRDEHEKDMNHLRATHYEQIQAKTAEIDTLKGQLEVANDQIELMTKKYTELDIKAGEKYASQIDMLKSEREAWYERSTQLKNLHKYTDKLKISVMIVAVAAALGIGFLVGCKVMSTSPTENNTIPVVTYYEIDDISEDE